MITARMPFGKYRGTMIHQIPTSYLKWLLREAVALDPRVRRDVDRVLLDRGVTPGGEQPPPPRHPPPAVPWQPVVKTWFARLSRKYHPDAGGTDEQMRVVNHAREVLEELLKAAG
jgi:hypothetical protein